mgnify:CR=1 FL=1
MTDSLPQKVGDYIMLEDQKVLVKCQFDDISIVKTPCVTREAAHESIPQEQAMPF